MLRSDDVRRKRAVCCPGSCQVRWPGNPPYHRSAAFEQAARRAIALNRQVEVLDSIHGRCCPKILKKRFLITSKELGEKMIKYFADANNN